MIAFPEFAFDAVSKPESGSGTISACAAPTLGEFARALRAADLFDITAIDVPGSYVVRPFGMKLVHRFRGLVRSAYERAGLAEHEYPDVVPRQAIEPLYDVIGERAASIGLSGRARDLVLVPTGEAVFLTHWARAFKRRSDFPVRSFRCGTYFRPVSRGHHAGRSIFRGLESHDVFEFHVADIDEAAHFRTLHDMHVMLRDLVESMRLPVVHGVRPPWTNNGELYRWALGGDAVLPGGATVQVTTLYDQGDAVATRFGVRIVDGLRSVPLITSGSITRRSLFAHLLIGLADRTRFLVHPELAPSEVIVLALDTATAGAVAAPLLARGNRVSTEIAPSTRELFRLQEGRWQQGVPITVALPQPTGERSRVTVRRTDTAEEMKLTGFAELPELVGDVLGAIGAAYDERAAAVYDHAVGEAPCACPAVIERTALVPTESVVRAFQAGRHGELLSFAQCAPAGCGVSGDKTYLLATHGRRV